MIYGQACDFSTITIVNVKFLSNFCQNLCVALPPISMLHYEIVSRSSSPPPLCLLLILASLSPSHPTLLSLSLFLSLFLSLSFSLSLFLSQSLSLSLCCCSLCVSIIVIKNEWFEIEWKKRYSSAMFNSFKV